MFSRHAVIAGALMFLSFGCHHHRSRDTTVVQDPTLFTLSQELHSEYDEDYYTWNTVLDQGRVQVRIRNFKEGVARLQIYDADGFEIFDQDYFDYYDYCCGDEVVEVDFTLDGTPGLWTIRLRVVDFTGSLYVTID